MGEELFLNLLVKTLIISRLQSNHNWTLKLLLENIKLVNTVAPFFQHVFVGGFCLFQIQQLH